MIFNKCMMIVITYHSQCPECEWSLTRINYFFASNCVVGKLQNTAVVQTTCYVACAHDSVVIEMTDASLWNRFWLLLITVCSFLVNQLAAFRRKCFEKVDILMYDRQTQTDRRGELNCWTDLSICHLSTTVANNFS